MEEDLDHRIGMIAESQHGAITRAQAMATGLTGRQIEVRLASGRWESIARGAYRIIGTERSWQQLASAATALRPGSVASHLTAAALADLGGAIPHRTHVTVPSTASGRHPFATVHRADLCATEVTRLNGMLATTVTRTLLDLAPDLGPRRLQVLLDESLHRRCTTPAALEVAIGQYRAARAQPGLQRLLELLEPWRGGIVPGSPAEARLLRQVVEWGFPAPEKQIVVRDHDGQAIARLDAGWSPRRIGLEYDSDRWHQPRRWAPDEIRHRRLTDLGWEVLHVGSADLHAGQTALRDRLLVIWARVPADVSSARPAV